MAILARALECQVGDLFGETGRQGKIAPVGFLDGKPTRSNLTQSLPLSLFKPGGGAFKFIRILLDGRLIHLYQMIRCCLLQNKAAKSEAICVYPQRLGNIS
ncbi:MAG: hypothetical protein AAGK14_08945 [Verrucomicrobiota bacterium]